MCVVLILFGNAARGFDDFLVALFASPGLGSRSAVIFMCGPMSM